MHLWWSVEHFRIARNVHMHFIDLPDVFMRKADQETILLLQES